jgi:hypothetical protein
LIIAFPWGYIVSVFAMVFSLSATMVSAALTFSASCISSTCKMMRTAPICLAQWLGSSCSTWWPSRGNHTLKAASLP